MFLNTVPTDDFGDNSYADIMKGKENPLWNNHRIENYPDIISHILNYNFIFDCI